MPNTVEIKRNDVRRSIIIADAVADDTAKSQAERDEAAALAAALRTQCPECDPDNPPPE